MDVSSLFMQEKGEWAFKRTGVHSMDVWSLFMQEKEIFSAGGCWPGMLGVTPCGLTFKC